MTDYENLSEFIPNLVSSILVDRVDNRITLKQVGSQQLIGLKFSAQVYLEIIENFSEGVLQFQMIKGDFRRFDGAWKIKPLDEGAYLLYELIVQGCIGMPVSLIEQRLRDDLTANLIAVEQEAIRRCKTLL